MKVRGNSEIPCGSHLSYDVSVVVDFEDDKVFLFDDVRRVLYGTWLGRFFDLHWPSYFSFPYSVCRRMR